MYTGEQSTLLFTHVYRRVIYSAVYTCIQESNLLCCLHIYTGEQSTLLFTHVYRRAINTWFPGKHGVIQYFTNTALKI